MSLLAADRLSTKQAKQRGTYLRDGKRLWRVVDSAQDEVCLEDCRYPEEAPIWVPVAKVLREMLLVRPARS